MSAVNSGIDVGNLVWAYAEEAFDISLRGIRVSDDRNGAFEYAGERQEGHRQPTSVVILRVAHEYKVVHRDD